LGELVDIRESDLLANEPCILKLLLCDKTSGRSIHWVTDDYSTMGDGFSPSDEILPERITGAYEGIVSPRNGKTKYHQTKRTRESAEVFTPSWLCCAQNNQVDDSWFGRSGAIFSNANPTTGWDVNEGEILFDSKHTWQEYVDKRVLEASCGEAPYLVSRYDVTTGEAIPVQRRMGLLDRKLRVVVENTLGDNNAFEYWLVRAYESTYAFDLQGDNVLLARENLLATLDEWCLFLTNRPASRSLRLKVANRIAWNVFQMDGLTLTVPYVLRPSPQMSLGLFDETPTLEPVPAKVRDWRSCTGGTALEFRGLVKARR